MVNKIIADYLKTNKRLIVPQFGAFLHKDDGTVAFVPFLKKRRRGADPTDRFGIRPESGRRTGCDRGIYRRNQKEHRRARRLYYRRYRNPENRFEQHLLPGFRTKGSAGHPCAPPVAAAPVSSPPAAARQQRPAPTTIPPVEKPQPAVPQKPATEQRTAAAPQPQSGIPPRRPVPQPTQQRPVQQQTPPHPGNPVRQTPPAQQVPNRAPQQPYQPPMPNAGNRPPMNQRPQQPGYPRRPQQPGRPVQKRSKADGFIVIAIITAIIALAVMIFGFLVSREGPDIQSIILPAQTDTATVQSAPAPDND